jgi:hypothetical protein
MSTRTLKAAYGIPELAEMGGMRPDQVRRLLVSNGVKLSKNGRIYVVFLSELKRALPDLWESILDRLEVVKAA